MDLSESDEYKSINDFTKEINMNDYCIIKFAYQKNSMEHTLLELIPYTENQNISLFIHKLKEKDAETIYQVNNHSKKFLTFDFYKESKDYEARGLRTLEILETELRREIPKYFDSDNIVNRLT